MKPVEKTEMVWRPVDWLRVSLTQVDDDMPSLTIGAMLCHSPNEELDRIIAALESVRSELGNMMGDHERAEEPSEV